MLPINSENDFFYAIATGIVASNDCVDEVKIFLLYSKHTGHLAQQIYTGSDLIFSILGLQTTVFKEPFISIF